MPPAAPLAAVAGDQEEDGEDREDEEEEGRGAKGGSKGARGRGPWRPPPTAAAPTLALLPGRHPPGVQTTPPGTRVPPPWGRGGRKRKGRRKAVSAPVCSSSIVIVSTHPRVRQQPQEHARLPASAAWLPTAPLPPPSVHTSAPDQPAHPPPPANRPEG